MVEELNVDVPFDAEVFIGGLPHAASEEEIKALLEEVAPIVKLRMPPAHVSTGMKNKGYAFAAYHTAQDASAAIERYKNYEWRGCTIGVTASRPRNELFLGNLPKWLTPKDFETRLRAVTPGLISVELAMGKGFAFAAYESNGAAERALKQEIIMDGSKVTTRYREPKANESALDQVTLSLPCSLPQPSVGEGGRSDIPLIILRQTCRAGANGLVHGALRSRQAHRHDACTRGDMHASHQQQNFLTGHVNGHVKPRPGTPNCMASHRTALHHVTAPCALLAS